MHVAEGEGDAAIAHGDGHLVQSLRKRAPEVPVVSSAAHACPWVALYGMVQVGKQERISYEEYRGVVSYQIPVPFLRVELDCKAANVPLGICRAPLTGYGGEAANISVFFPIFEKILALVYLVMSWVTVNVP